MQIHKPMPLGLSTRPIEYRKRFGLCITASLHVPFSQAARGTLWGEQSMWAFLAQEMAVPMIDEGVAKLTPEFLVHGCAWPDPAQPQACAVRARVGNLEKTLLAFGERRWDGDHATPPQPFESMPLTWSRTYGGPDFPANPEGRGRAAVDGTRWLPNIESPASRIVRPDQAVAPAGWGALDIMHPQRAQYRGTYGADYLQTDAPGFAADLDWRFFNLAPPDQWFAQPLRGDEAFAFDHMHPTQRRIEGRLPGLAARVFADYAMPGGQTRLREVPLRLTTAWFFPHAQRCILLYQGLAEVDTDDGSDIRCLMGAVDRLGEPRSDDHYAAVLDKRADPRMGGVHALNDADLLPEGLDDADPAAEQARAVFSSENLQAEAQRRRAAIEVQHAREQAVAQGKDPDALGIRMPPKDEPPKGTAGLAAYLEQKHKEIEQQQWAALEDLVQQAEKALDFIDAHKLDPAALVHRGPPRLTAEDRLGALQAQAAAQGRPLDARVYPALIKQEEAERAGYLQSAHAQAPAARMAPAPARALRSEIERAVSLGMKRFAGMDFTGCDFSGLDLRGCSFAGAWLESADLARANLSGADFSAAVLAHADLSGAVAVGTRFASANLGGARLKDAVMDEADFGGAMLSRCDFTGTQFRRSRLGDAMLLESTWGPADWSGAIAPQQTFHKLNLQGMVLAEADLSGAAFIECDLSGVDLRAAILTHATFTQCKLDGARLTGVQADAVVFAGGASLRGCDLQHARLRGAHLGEAVLQGSRMMHAQLDGAFLGAADLSGVDLRLASAKGALLRRAVLRKTRLAGANLSDAVLQQADLRGADLRRSNLFGADLSRVRLDGDARFDQALLTRARTWPRLTPEQQAAA